MSKVKIVDFFVLTILDIYTYLILIKKSPSYRHPSWWPTYKRGLTSRMANFSMKSSTSSIVLRFREFIYFTYILLTFIFGDCQIFMRVFKLKKINSCGFRTFWPARTPAFNRLRCQSDGRQRGKWERSAHQAERYDSFRYKGIGMTRIYINVTILNRKYDTNFFFWI